MAGGLELGDLHGPFQPKPSFDYHKESPRKIEIKWFLVIERKLRKMQLK